MSGTEREKKVEPSSSILAQMFSSYVQSHPLLSVFLSLIR